MDKFFSYLALVVVVCIVLWFLTPKLLAIEVSPRTNVLLVLIFWAVLIGIAYWGYRTGDFSWWVAVLVSLFPPLLELFKFLFSSNPVVHAPLPTPPPDAPTESPIEVKIDALLKKNRDA